LLNFYGVTDEEDAEVWDGTRLHLGDLSMQEHRSLGVLWPEIEKHGFSFPFYDDTRLTVVQTAQLTEIMQRFVDQNTGGKQTLSKLLGMISTARDRGLGVLVRCP
jgi:hypothetical protein